MNRPSTEPKLTILSVCKQEALAQAGKRGLVYLSLMAVLVLIGSSHWLGQLHGELLAGLQPPTIAGISINFGTFDFGNLVIGQFTLMMLSMLVVWYCGLKTLNANSVTKDKDSFVWLVLAVGVLARLILIGADPYTSNDVDRYLFDGRIALTGLDPYQVSHDHPALAQLRELWQPPAEHAKYPTLYPPLALAMFAFAANIGVGFDVESAQLAWQLMLTGASIASLYFIYLLLKAHNKLQHLPLVALSPILIVETGVGLHLDAFSTLAVVAALYYWHRNKLSLVGICIGLGVLCKILPLVLLMPLVFANFSWRRSSIIVLSALSVIIAGYGITLALGFYPVGSIGVFFEKWRFAAPLFSLLNQLNPQAFVIALTAITTSLIVAVGLLAISHQQLNNQQTVVNKEIASAESDLKTKHYTLSEPLILACHLALVIPLLISPVLFPWYLMPLAALLALKPNAALMIVLGVMPLTYEVLNQFICCQIWQPAQWPIVLLASAYLFALVSLIYWGIKWANSNKAARHHAGRDQRQIDISLKRASEA